MVTVGTILVACAGIVTVCAVLAVKELMEIRSDTTFSWQMLKDVFFELKALNKHFSDEKAERIRTEEMILKLHKKWDQEGMPEQRNEGTK